MRGIGVELAERETRPTPSFLRRYSGYTERRYEDIEPRLAIHAPPI